MWDLEDLPSGTRNTMVDGVRIKNDNKNNNQSVEILLVISFLVIGSLIRFALFDKVSADTNGFASWLEQIRNVGLLSAFSNYVGDYNITFIPLLYVTGLLPFSEIVCVKLFALLLDLLGMVVGFLYLQTLAEENGVLNPQKRYFGELGMALIWLSPITIGNAGYQAQLEGLWAFPGFLSLYMFRKKHPAVGMFLLAFAIAMKPQGVFFLPFVLLYYFRTRSFSIFHFVFFFLAIELLSIPSILAGNSIFMFWEHFFDQSGLYPFVYYYYPNIWIWMRDYPYWVFAKVGIGMMMTAFLLVTVAYVRNCRDRNWTFMMDFELIIWSLMTCSMFLPAMHERYNYPAEVMLPILSIFDKEYRIPAVVLVLSGFLCNGFSYYGWGHPEFYGISVLNIIVYLCLTLGIAGTIRGKSEKE